MRVLLIVNRNSRSGAEAEAELRDRLSDAGIEAVVPALERAEDVGPAIRDHADAVDAVVVGGGDGSLNNALDALLETGLPLGVIPLGTANDFARSVGIPLELEAAVAVIAGGRRHKVDVGRVNGHPFLNLASLGLSVEIARRLTGRAKRVWGALAYALTLSEVVRAMRPIRLEIDCDDERIKTRALQVGVGAGRFYGGGMVVDEAARNDDGLLRLYIVEPRPTWRLLMLLPALRHGRQREWEGVVTRTCRGIRIARRKRVRINTDGEITTRTPAEFSVHARALSVYVPEELGPGLSDETDA